MSDPIRPARPAALLAALALLATPLPALAQKGTTAAAAPPDPYAALEACAIIVARRLSILRETADVVADGSIGACVEQEHAFALSIFAVYPVDREGNVTARETFEFRILRLKRKLTAIVLNERLNRGG